MAVFFTNEEFANRKQATLLAMEEAGLDALLMFRQESMYWLSGYDTFGFCFFQCLVLTPDGTLTLLTRRPDLLQAERTSILTDIRIWADADTADPVADLKAILADKGLAGQRLGVEYEAYGLTGARAKRLDHALEGWAQLEDASMLVSGLRVVKSPAEIAYVRKAAELCDNALDEAHRLAVPGAFEGDILAAMQGAVFKGGGDYPGNEFIIGSGDLGLLCRYQAGRRHLDDNDQLMLEWAGAFRHYHVAMMRTVIVGMPRVEHRAMHAAGVDAIEACEAAIRPGATFGEVYDAHARSFDAAGFGHARMFACGYSLGTTFAPIWMDWPMLYAGNPVEIRPGMVIFLHMILADRDKNVAMAPGHTVLVTEEGCERLSRQPLDLRVNA